MEYCECFRNGASPNAVAGYEITRIDTALSAREDLMAERPQISMLEMAHVDRVLWMGGGYVLDFSDRTMATFFAEELGIEIFHSTYARYGNSKAKYLRCFLQTVDSPTAARVLRRLFDHRLDVMGTSGRAESDQISVDKYHRLIERLERGGIRTEGIEKFTANPTLDELVASIERDIQANKPHAALDRLHTFCMKKFAHLLSLRGESTNRNETLNGRAGRYFNPLRRDGRVQPITDKIMKSSVEIFELFNGIRNNASLAHDNELIQPAEARFIFESVANMLRFLKSVEGQAFENGGPENNDAQPVSPGNGNGI